jgi:hypothetical protein
LIECDLSLAKSVVNSKTAFPYFFFHHIFHYVHFPSLHFCALQISFTWNCTMPKQLTTKRKTEGPDYEQEAVPAKKLQKPSSQPATQHSTASCLRYWFIPPRESPASELHLGLLNQRLTVLEILHLYRFHRKLLLSCINDWSVLDLYIVKGWGSWTTRTTRGEDSPEEKD